MKMRSVQSGVHFSSGVNPLLPPCCPCPPAAPLLRACPRARVPAAGLRTCWLRRLLAMVHVVPATD